jgi:hypothetical protein
VHRGEPRTTWLAILPTFCSIFLSKRDRLKERSFCLGRIESFTDAPGGKLWDNDTLAAIEEAMQSFNAIPFVGVDVPGSEEITRLRTGMEETALTLRDFREELQVKKAEAVAEAVDRVTQPLNRMNTRVGEIREEVSDVEARAGAASDRLAYVQSQVPCWVDIASIVITLILAWIMLSQVAVFVLCLKYLQGKVS